jgi:ribonuclease HI
LKVIIYIKIECHGNPSGYAKTVIYLTYKSNVSKVTLVKQDVTKNAMCIVAVIEALKKLLKPCEVQIYLDSDYVINAMAHMRQWKANGWKRAGMREVKNKVLWQQLDMLTQIHKVNVSRFSESQEKRWRELCEV